MLGTYKPITALENNINTAFQLYKASLVKNFLKQVNDEELKGESCRQYNFSFYLAVYLVVLVYNEVLKYPTKEWSYFVDKYKLEDYKKCLSCEGVNLDDILKSFGLNIVLTSGINSVIVESTFEVEPTNLTVIEEVIVQIDLDTILNIISCENNISTTC